MKCKRFYTTQPEDLLAAIDAAAEAAGMSRSEWMGEAAKKALPKDVRSKLSERPKASRPPKQRDG